MPLLKHDEQPIETWRPGVLTRMRTSEANGASRLTIFEQWVAPGQGAPTHWHPVEEVLTVLSGEADIWFEGNRQHAAAGCSALVPAGVRHGFANTGSEELHMLAILAAPIFEAHFEDGQSVARRWFSEGRKDAESASPGPSEM